MGYREELTELVKEWTEDSIDITDNWNEWENFLTEEGYIQTYKQVYEMDLGHLQSFGKDFDNTDHYLNSDGSWNVEQLIDEDNDITKMSNGCYFVHNQDYIDEYTINKFYEQQKEKEKQKALNWAINQAYIDLDKSSNAFCRFDALLLILGHDFGYESERFYLLSEIYKTKNELLKCINDVLELMNQSIDDGFIKLWLPNHYTYSNEEDEKYCELIRFGGYEILSDGEKILNSDAILLKNEESIHTLEYYTYENIHQLCNYIQELFEYYKEDCFNVGDRVYEQKINQKLNNIIDNYWMNTVEFDYAEFYLNQGDE